MKDLLNSFDASCPLLTLRVLRRRNLSKATQSHLVCVCAFALQDLKDEKKKARMAAARAVLEKCTMMLLTASKVNRRPTNTGPRGKVYKFCSP